jgi:hypothetical protein
MYGFTIKALEDRIEQYDRSEEEQLKSDSKPKSKSSENKRPRAAARVSGAADSR